MMKKVVILTGVILLLFSLHSSNLTAQAQEKLINLDVEDIDIKTALKMIAQQADLNVVISKNVVGIVTIKLENVKLEKALEAILKMNNYLYTLKDNMIKVFSYQELQQEERFARKETKVFSLQYTDVLDLRRILLSMKTPRGKIELNPKNNQIIVTDMPDKVKEIEEALKKLDQPIEMCKYNLLYAKAKDVQAKLLQVIPKEKGEIFIDERTNSIVIKATPVVLQNIDELIKGWDIRHRQVLIEAKILEVTLDKKTSLGIDWQYQIEDPRKDPNSVDLSGKFALNLKTGGVLKMGGALRPDEYNATLEALKNNTDAEVLSSPRIVVIDGEQAKILIGSNEPYIVTTTDPISHLVLEEVKYVDVGIKLIVTPHIGEDNYITMKIHPEVSTAKRVLNEKAVQVITTEADTTMMVKDGETIILGGLIKNKKEKIVDKIPFLGSIPLLGLLFRKTTDEDIKQEILIFITPHIFTEESRQVISKEQWDKTVERTGKTNVIIEEGFLEKSRPTPKKSTKE